MNDADKKELLMVADTIETNGGWRIAAVKIRGFVEDYDTLAAELAAAEKQWNVDVAARGKLLNRVAELEAALNEIRRTSMSDAIINIAIAALGSPAETRGIQMSETGDLSDAASAFADYQITLLERGQSFGVRASLVAAFLKGWAHAKRSEADRAGESNV